jgi:hypothetical protein
MIQTKKKEKQRVAHTKKVNEYIYRKLDSHKMNLLKLFCQKTELRGMY